jgi:hypothetical protein
LGDKIRRFLVTTAEDLQRTAALRVPACYLFYGIGEGGALQRRGLPAAARVTHPSRTWGDSTLDYIFTRGLVPEGPAHVPPAGALSDHAPVFLLVSPERR